MPDDSTIVLNLPFKTMESFDHGASGIRYLIILYDGRICEATYTCYSGEFRLVSDGLFVNAREVHGWAIAEVNLEPKDFWRYE